MKPITPQLEPKNGRPLYLQIYDYIRRGILTREMTAGEKLPSLRALAKSLEVSVTTIDQAYAQLEVEGYISARPQSGYYVSRVSGEGWQGGEDGGDGRSRHEGAGVDGGEANGDSWSSHEATRDSWGRHEATREFGESAPLLYDLSCFDFGKWKKCSARVLSEMAPLLTCESDPQGELALRQEIARYIYQSRGVACDPEQVVIGAGTQQITLHLSRILHQMQINHVAVEEPGYLPVQNILRDHGFVMTPVNVGGEGIDISRLPANIRSAAYVCPSNQFPTGAVMPIGRRYELLEWARRNDSFIVEDDYDSELRYFGRPVPPLKSLDDNDRVIYLGSFSATLFPAIKISYMVLTPQLTEIFKSMMGQYTQTCSKTEQLTLALFMNQGYYQTNIRRLRSLYSQKLQAISAAVEKYGKGRLLVQRASSGLNVILRVSSDKPADELCAAASKLGVNVSPVVTGLVLYYHQIPLGEIDELVQKLASSWL